MDLTPFLANVTLMSLVLVGFTAMSMGLYFAAVGKFKPTPKPLIGLVTFIVIGWSFYIPLFASAVAEGRPNAERFVGSMLLWAFFAIVAATSLYLAVAVATYRRMVRGVLPDPTPKDVIDATMTQDAEDQN